MADDLTVLTNTNKLALAKKTLGEHPGVTMEDKTGVVRCAPHVCAAVTADSMDQVLTYCAELAETIKQGFPAWRSWHLEYREGV